MAGLAELGDAGHFYNWGLFLPLCIETWKVDL
jgi:hypothetical protein